MDLLGYGSASEDEAAPAPPIAEREKRAAEEQAGDALPAVKRPRKLPALGGAFDMDPIDDPSQHQGRLRARPFVQGDWNAHVYLSLQPSKRLRAALDGVIARLNDSLPDPIIHSLLDASTPAPAPALDAAHAVQPTQPRTLHVSLSHPLPLRRDQVRLLLDHLRRAARAGIGGRVQVSLVPSVVTYQNGEAATKGGEGGAEAASPDLDARGKADEDGLLAGLGRSGIGRGGRAFLALRVGTGHDQLARIQDTILTPFLKRHHLPLYHNQPEFHASFAWALARPALPSGSDGTATTAARWDNPFDANVLASANNHTAEVERAIGKGWEVDALEVKVGKTITRIAL